MDFAYLVDLAIIDMLFRRLILGMALDIEHFEKVKLLNAMKNKNDDGYSILRSYFVSLETGGPANDKERSKLFGEIENNRSSIYCRDMLSHIPAGQEYPVWVFLEVITFGRFLSFLKFCADYFDDDSLRDDYYMMKKVKSLRNAAGHSNCILNDLALRNREDTVDINDRVVKRFCRIVPGAKYEIDHKGPNEIQNDRLKELVTLFSMHSKILPAPTMKSHWHEELESFLVRALRHYDEYYKANPPISNTIQIILKMVQGWY